MRARAEQVHGTLTVRSDPDTGDDDRAGGAGMIRILLVDDHPVVRHGLRGMLDAEPDLTVVGEASSGTAGRRGGPGADARTSC